MLPMDTISAKFWAAYLQITQFKDVFEKTQLQKYRA